jgi:hypothetical protein
LVNHGWGVCCEKTKITNLYSFKPEMALHDGEKGWRCSKDPM